MLELSGFSLILDTYSSHDTNMYGIELGPLAYMVIPGSAVH